MYKPLNILNCCLNMRYIFTLVFSILNLPICSSILQTSLSYSLNILILFFKHPYLILQTSLSYSLNILILFFKHPYLILKSKNDAYIVHLRISKKCLPVFVITLQYALLYCSRVNLNKR